MNFLMALLLGWSIFIPEARAIMHSLPKDLTSSVLSESVPTAFAPTHFEVSDFEVVWADGPPPGTDVLLINGSLEWVRVADFLVVPRARLRITTQAAAGRVSTGGFSQSLVEVGGESGGKRVAEIPVALISGKGNPIEVVTVQGGRESHAKLEIRFNPKNSAPKDRIFFDPSCSPFQVHLEGPPSLDTGWANIGCRLVTVEAGDHRTSSLEMFVFWDGPVEAIEIDGVKTPSIIGSVWALRQRASPGKILFKNGKQQFGLSYSVPENLHFFSLGAGIGPYSYSFFGAGEESSTYSPILTVYGSYFVTEVTRVVAFDVLAMNNHLYSDFGLYLVNESFRTLDRRIGVNVLLGAHLVGFKSGSQYYFKPGAPQGLEVIFTDAFRKGFNLSAGAFIFPTTGGKSYNNMWLRWGAGTAFGELNYISSQETIDQVLIYQRAFGFSVGFPLGKIF